MGEAEEEREQEGDGITTSLLELTGKDLEREIAKIAKANPPRNHQWTTKEIDIVKALHDKGVPHAVIAERLGVKRTSVDNLVYRSPYYE